MSLRLVRRFLVVGAVLILPVSGFAQEATLSGTVTDTTGGVLPGVTINVTNEDTGLVREVVTGPGGSYLITQIVPGRYRVGAKLEGLLKDRRGERVVDDH